MLDVVSNLIDSFSLAFSSFLFGNLIINKNSALKKKTILLVYLLFAVIHTLLLLLGVSFVSKFFYIICFFITFKYIYRLSLKDTIFSILLYYIMILFSEVLLLFFGFIFFKLSGKQIYNIFGETFIMNISVSIFSIIFGFIFKKLINKLLNINIKKIMLSFWMVIILVLCIFFIYAFSNKSYNFGTIFVLIIICIFSVVIFISFFQAIKNNELEMKYDKLLEFIKKYEIEIDKQRTMRHETKNQLLIIKSKLIDKDSQKNVISYIDEIIKDNNKKINHSEYAKLRYLPSNGLKGLFYFKTDEAIDKDIHVDINVSKSIENSFLYRLNNNTFNQLGKILGIFLDNAIEAAKESKDKNLGIEIYLNKNKINFIISNSYLKLNDNLKSTKGNNRGHGLLLAKTIIKSNNKLSNEMEITDKLFIQKLSIKK